MRKIVPASIPTVASLQRDRRRIDRRRLSAEQVIRRMRDDGEVLRLTFTKSGPIWTLQPTGTPVSEEVATILVADIRVEAVGDALFRGATAQTYRFIP
jgi:hypothetical protein